MEELLVSNQDHSHQTDPETESPTSAATSSSPDSTAKEPLSSLHPPLLHPSSPSPAVSPLSDQTYLQAAAIFQRLRMDKPITQELLHYGKKMDTPLPESRDKTTQRRAYQLAFSTLKYQDLLEDIMIDSCFHTSQQISADLLPLAMVMLFDLQDRKFLMHDRPAKEGEELLREVRNLENCLHRCKIKLAASLARCRVKQNLLSVSCVLSDPVRTKQHRARLLPLYAWVNTLKNSVEEVCEVLQSEGLCEVENVTDLKESEFCRDALCPDTLVFPRQLYTLLQHSQLTVTHAINIQDRSVCVAVSALRPLLSDDRDVLVTGAFSALTVAHIAVLAAARSGKVLVCAADHTPAHTEEIQQVLTQMDVKNVRILSEPFCGLDEWDGMVQRLQVIMVLPQCSSSALNDPVHTIHSEHGDCDLLQDLSQGSVSHSKIHTLAAQQARLLAHALTFPKVQTVVYCTRSVYPEENEQLVKRVLEKANTHPKLLPFRLSAPVLSEAAGSETDKFFRIEASQHTNGCFIARLAREVDPTKAETVQDVLARAAAKGLLGGIVPAGDNSKTGKKGRKEGRRSRAPTTAGKPSSPSERGEGEYEGSEEEEEGEKGDEDEGVKGTKGGKRRGLKGSKAKPKRRPKQTRRTLTVSKVRPNRLRKKPANRKVHLRPRGPAKRKPRDQLASPVPTLTSPNPSHHSSPVTPHANTLADDPPTMISQQPVSSTTSPIGKPLSPDRPAPPTPHTASKRAEKTFKVVAKPGSPRKGAGKAVRAKEAAVMQEALKPVDFVLPPASSPTFSSLSSRSGSSVSLAPSRASPAQLTQTSASSSSASLCSQDKQGDQAQ
ncbi:putative methyltransferase NSUN7 [Centroberyx affinis]|uniref:putative methyltransferase NSUN7 n=1 Tax=Centroberyx affinis TaxID=166261 RepID=UPI003A5C0BDA